MVFLGKAPIHPHSTTDRSIVVRDPFNAISPSSFIHRFVSDGMKRNDINAMHTGMVVLSQIKAMNSK